MAKRTKKPAENKRQKARDDSEPSLWRAFQHRAFAALWIATVISNIGTWLHDVAAGWLMTTLAPTPLMVSLVQAATTLPVFLFALPAGALADMFDRRRLLIAVSVFLAANACLLSVIVATGAVTPWVLLVFTLLAGTGAAFLMPVWHAIVPQMVPRADLSKAVTLNSLGINLSRAIGPALGGVLIAAFGIALPFLVNAISFLAVVAALIWWRGRPPAKSSLPAERFFGAIRVGLRYARESREMRATLVRAVGFFLFASAYWALLPLIVRTQLGGGPGLYGVLVASIGLGAVVGGLFLPRFRSRFGADRLVAAGTFATGMVLVAFSVAASPVIATAASLAAGVSWMAVLANLNITAQVSLPEWVRARGMSVFLMVYFGSMAAGSAAWGQIANFTGIKTALLAAGAGAVVSVLATLRWRLPLDEDTDLTPTIRPEPYVAEPIEGDRGPVMVTIEYRIDPKRTAAFMDALHELSKSKLRGGAFAWGVFEDVSEPGRFLEYFMSESWLEHLRQHERLTVSGMHQEDEVYEFHIGSEKPVVKHYIAPDRK